MPVSYIRFKGLESGSLYKEQKSGKVYPADALMEVGMPVPVQYHPYQAEQVHFVRIEKREIF